MLFLRLFTGMAENKKSGSRLDDQKEKLAESQRTWEDFLESTPAMLGLAAIVVLFVISVAAGFFRNGLGDAWPILVLVAAAAGWFFLNRRGRE